MSTISGRTCTVDGCQKPLECRGMCQAHYMAFRRAGGKKVNVGGVCAIEGCKDKYFSKGYCKIHFLRMLRHGTPDRIYEDHKMHDTDEYGIWLGMKQRCLNPKSTAYENYGGRGIQMEKTWQTSFLAFYEYIGPRPSAKYSVERIDNNGNYEPGNVRWATKSEQNHNQRIRKTNTSGYMGVYWRKDNQKWVASINRDGKRYHLGVYDTAEEAADVYNKASVKLFGDHKYLNIIKPIENEAQDDEFIEDRPRTEEEIWEAEHEFFDRVWYNRKMVMFQNIQLGKEEMPSEDLMDSITDAMRGMEEDYGGQENLIYTDFEWGMVNGKLSALRWVMGSDWDFLDT